MGILASVVLLQQVKANILCDAIGTGQLNCQTQRAKQDEVINYRPLDWNTLRPDLGSVGRKKEIGFPLKRSHCFFWFKISEQIGPNFERKFRTEFFRRRLVFTTQQETPFLIWAVIYCCKKERVRVWLSWVSLLRGRHVGRNLRNPMPRDTGVW